MQLNISHFVRNMDRKWCKSNFLFLDTCSRGLSVEISEIFHLRCSNPFVQTWTCKTFITGSLTSFLGLTAPWHWPRWTSESEWRRSDSQCRVRCGSLQKETVKTFLNVGPNLSASWWACLGGAPGPASGPQTPHWSRNSQMTQCQTTSWTRCLSRS